MFNINSPFFRFITSIGNLIIVSVLWALCCLPVVTIGASTAALYYTCVKVIRHDRGYVISSFFHSLRSNLKQGIPITVLGLLFCFILYTDYRYITSMEAAPSWMVIIYQAALTFFACLLIYLIANLSRFAVSFPALLKLSVFMMIRHFYRTLVLLVLLIAAGILMLAMPFTVIILPGVYMLLTSLVMEKTLKKYTPAAEDGSDEGQWYLE